MTKLVKRGKFSGAVVVRGEKGPLFAAGYGWADPFSFRAFKPDTPVDSASLAKPVTSAAVLLLAREGRIDLDSPVKRYLPEYPNAETSVRHLLAHSAGLRFDAVEDITGKTNAEMLAEFGKADLRFPPGSAFTYCNACYVTLALLIERVTGQHYLTVARNRTALPADVTIRPARLADWRGRAIGYRRTAEGEFERADSYENELFYGTANFSISAQQLAEWGAQWWGPRLAPIQALATTPAMIGDRASGLTWGNWYCGKTRLRCHYLGHHEGFHHMLYWDADRRISVAMVSNNTLAPALMQRLQRALVAYAEGAPNRGRGEVVRPLNDADAPTGTFTLSSGETVAIISNGEDKSVRRNGVAYPAYLVGSGIRYVPGLDLYIAGTASGELQWLSLYESFVGKPNPEVSQ